MGTDVLLAGSVFLETFCWRNFQVLFSSIGLPQCSSVSIGKPWFHLVGIKNEIVVKIWQFFLLFLTVKQNCFSVPYLLAFSLYVLFYVRNSKFLLSFKPDSAYFKNNVSVAFCNNFFKYQNNKCRLK